MTSWRRADKLRVVSGICHICKEPADGKRVFQTRFCDTCMRRGMNLEYGVPSEYALIPALYKIQTTYDDIAQDIVRAINGSLPPAQKPGSSRDKIVEEESWPNSTSLSIGHSVNLSGVETYSVETVPLPSTEVATSAQR